MSFVDSGKAVILNSRQALYPCGTDPWIVATARAIDDIAQKKLTLLTSVGTPAWEIGLHLAQMKNVPMILLISCIHGEDLNQKLDSCITDFRLDPNLVRVIGISSDGASKERLALQAERDRRIIEMADVVYPVSIRTGGNLDTLLSDAIKGNKSIEYDFTAPWQSGKVGHLVPIKPEILEPGLDNNLRDYIIHWTRAVHYPWPGETRHDFYNAIVQSGDSHPRSALKTLLRILTEMRLRSSPKHMRRGVQAVSFSSLPPSRAVELMRWRARYREMTFEAYGIAIRQSAAERVGVEKAIYGNPEMIAYLAEDEKPYFQSLGTIGDWEKEREFRHIGDMDLHAFDKSEICVITRLPSDIDKINTVFNGDILVMTKK